MKAVLCKQHGLPDTLVVEEVPALTPAAGQVVVSMKAAGVNFPDALIIQGKYQAKPPFPFSPGTELAGVVKSVGEGVKRPKPGDAVIAFASWGGYAEEIAVDARACIALPAGVDFKVGASFMMTYGTSYHALKDRALLKAGETLLVLGAAGGVGSAAVELGKLMGARVIAAASSDDKLDACKLLGADATINYSKEDLREGIKRITEGKGVDVVYDPVGDKFAEPAMRDMAWGGRYLVIGFAGGEIPKIALNLPLLKGFSIVGVFWGSFTRKEPQKNEANVGELLGWIASGKLKPLVSASYPLEQAARALNDVMQRKVTGKVVLIPG
ncbi:MAG: NADPH:quinone oxidoreductase family protein [Betaproteobacteria bacterium]|nr:MAG: NADPH:quinone oxidoreductase family protein [Betaproteobacteria bacterium]